MIRKTSRKNDKFVLIRKTSRKNGKLDLIRLLKDKMAVIHEFVISIIHELFQSF